MKTGKMSGDESEPEAKPAENKKKGVNGVRLTSHFSVSTGRALCNYYLIKN